MQPIEPRPTHTVGVNTAHQARTFVRPPPPEGPDWIEIGVFGALALLSGACCLNVFRGRLLYAILMIAMIGYTLLLIRKGPRGPTWIELERWSKQRVVRFSSVVIVCVVVVTNYFPTEWIDLVYTPRMFVAYIASLLAVCFHAIVAWRCPADKSAGWELSRPAWRYVATGCAWTSIALLVLIDISLFPATISERPDHWWHAFLPTQR